MVYYRKGTLRTNSEDSNRRTTETSESKETLATTYMLVTEHLLSSADHLEPSRKASPTALFFFNITQPPYAIARCSRGVKNFAKFLSKKLNKPIRSVFSGIYLRETTQGSNENHKTSIGNTLDFVSAKMTSAKNFSCPRHRIYLYTHFICRL